MKCPECGRSMIWNNDYDGEDIGVEYPSIVRMYSCECGVFAEITIPLNKEEE